MEQWKNSAKMNGHIAFIENISNYKISVSGFHWNTYCNIQRQVLRFASFQTYSDTFVWVFSLISLRNPLSLLIPVDNSVNFWNRGQQTVLSWSGQSGQLVNISQCHEGTFLRELWKWVHCFAVNGSFLWAH